jgi:glycerol kinase
MDKHFLVIDQGTTSSRAIVFTADLRIVATAQREFPQHFPAPGWVEHDPDDLWTTSLTVCQAVMDKAGLAAGDIAALGLTNQRETVVVWDRITGKPIHNAIVWQDRRTAAFCDRLRDAGHEPMIAAKTGLLIDPYFSASKIAWILEHVPGAREQAQAGRLACGTVDSFLLWRLTLGASHVTDATNASRTQLYNIHEGDWDEALLALFDIPRAMLPQVRDSSGDLGETYVEWFDGVIPIRGLAGDQQAALIGQACLSPGMAKATYGTGCFLLLNTGDTPVASKQRLLTTVAYQLDGKPTYALEGSIFVAGAALQWLRDGLRVLPDASQADVMAGRAAGGEVLMVPAFVGLGAPDWRPEARGAIFGLTRATNPDDLVRAALESVCHQTRDLLDAMAADLGDNHELDRLRVDGGMSASDWMLQALADLLDAPVDRPETREATALGAAWLARRAIMPDADHTAFWRLDCSFEPATDAGLRQASASRWRRAVAAVMSMEGAA